MDLRSLYTIIAIIAAIVVVEFYKRERNRITANLHTDNLRQLLTITTLEYQVGQLTITNERERASIEKKVEILVASYERGEIQGDAFQKRMDILIKKVK